MSTAVFLYITAADEAEARALARTLVEERLAACVNILGGIRSVYSWQGTIEESSEIALIAKTTKDRAAAAKDRIVELHSYETPCVTALDIADNGSNAAFLTWIQDSVQR